MEGLLVLVHHCCNVFSEENEKKGEHKKGDNSNFIHGLYLWNIPFVFVVHHSLKTQCTHEGGPMSRKDFGDGNCYSTSGGQLWAVATLTERIYQDKLGKQENGMGDLWQFTVLSVSRVISELPQKTCFERTLHITLGILRNLSSVLQPTWRNTGQLWLYGGLKR